MKKYLGIILILFALLSALVGCGDDPKMQNMRWGVVSNSDPEMIKIVNETTEKFDRPSNIWIHAAYTAGDIILKCQNHPVAFSPVNPLDCYTNEEMGFSISQIDTYSIKIHFDENTSGAPEKTDQITITNGDQYSVICNTFLWITRSFGEINPAHNIILEY